MSRETPIPIYLYHDADLRDPQPVSGDTLVDVILADGYAATGMAHTFNWAPCSAGTIVGWKRHRQPFLEMDFGDVERVIMAALKDKAVTQRDLAEQMRPAPTNGTSPHDDDYVARPVHFGYDPSGPDGFDCAAMFTRGADGTVKFVSTPIIGPSADDFLRYLFGDTPAFTFETPPCDWATKDRKRDIFDELSDHYAKFPDHVIDTLEAAHKAEEAARAAAGKPAPWPKAAEAKVHHSDQWTAAEAEKIKALKVGDRVRCDNNTEWAGEDMEVTHVESPAYVSVRHPTLGISGWGSVNLYRVPSPINRIEPAPYVKEFRDRYFPETTLHRWDVMYSPAEAEAARLRMEARDQMVKACTSPAKAPDTLRGATASQRKATPMARGLLDYFPDALAAVAAVSKIGNDQHNPGEPMHWAKEKSTDEADCILRHLADRGTWDHDGLRHSAKVAWRALALLQREIEATTDGVV